jgi:hypothetical protein
MGKVTSRSMSKDMIDSKNKAKSGVSVGGILTFSTVTDLQNAYPNGLDVPVWIKTDKSWFYWDGVTDLYEYLIPPTTAKLTSTSQGIKGSEFTMKMTKQLKEVCMYGTPSQWELWESDATHTLIGKLATGVFGSSDSEGYLVSTLTTPITLSANKNYVIQIPSFTNPANATRYVTSPSSGATNDQILNATGWKFNDTSAVVGMQGLANAYVYDMKIKLG